MKPSRNDFERFLKKHRALRRWKRNATKALHLNMYFATVKPRSWICSAFDYTKSDEAIEWNEQYAVVYWTELSILWVRFCVDMEGE